MRSPTVRARNGAAQSVALRLIHIFGTIAPKELNETAQEEIVG